MRRFPFILLPVLFAAVLASGGVWTPDYLGDGYEMRHVDQGTDYSGKVRSTIIRKASPCGAHRGILYVHGYNDYFFQKEMGDRFVDSCISFYAVDLRKYGRSITDGQKKFQARDLHEYFDDIDSALAQMHRDGIDDIALMGHSTGGLITSLYMNDRPDSTIRGLILNSPFLDWNFKGMMKSVAIPVVGQLGRLFPKMQVSQGNGHGYQESLLKSHHGEWDYNQDWKVWTPEKVEASWINAISSAQRELRKRPAIKVPVLLMHSSGSTGGGWAPDYQRNDAVLNVDDIVRIGRKLGPDVTDDTVKDGLHDLMLSAPQVRERVYDDIFAWLRGKNILD